MGAVSVCGRCEQPIPDQEEHICQQWAVKTKAWFNHLNERIFRVEQKIKELEDKQ